MTIEKNDKVYLVTETAGGWLLKDAADDSAPTFKVTKGICRNLDELRAIVEGSSLY